MAVLGLCCCTGFFFPFVENGGYSLVAMSGLLIAVAFLVAEQRRQDARTLVIVAHGLSSRCSWGLEHRLSGCGAGTWFARPPVRPSWIRDPTCVSGIGRILITGPPGKPLVEIVLSLHFQASWSGNFVTAKCRFYLIEDSVIHSIFKY